MKTFVMKELMRFKSVFYFISILPIQTNNRDNARSSKKVSLRKRCLYSEFSWTVFSRISICSKAFKAFIKPFEAPQRRKCGPEKLRIQKLFTQIVFKEINVFNKPHKKIRLLSETYSKPY